MTGGSVADAFDVLADETRVRILETLGRGRGGGSDPTAYSDLMAAVGATDSGRFNYHLDRLCDHFVERTDDGYDLSYEGVLVYRSIVAGTFSEAPPRETVPVQGPCHECGAELQASHDDHILHVACPACETPFLAGYLPPRGYADRTEAALLDALDRRIRHQIGLIAGGVCPWCFGTASAELGPATGSPLADRPVETAVGHHCDHCGARAWSTTGQLVVDHPAVVAFHQRHGVSLDSRRLWELEFAVTDRNVTVTAQAPRRVELAIPQGDDELRVDIDDRGRVTAIGGAAE